MSKRSTQAGWVVVSPDRIIYDFTFERTRTESISRWNKTLYKPNWRKDKREGFRCVKAIMTIEIE